MIPGANLLAMALTAITPQVVQYWAYVARATSPSGLLLTAYNLPEDVPGSFQPVSRAAANQMGLDVSKSFATFYASRRFATVGRNTAGDQFTFAGRRYQSHDLVDWNAQDGWNSILVQDIGEAAALLNGQLDFSKDGNPLIVVI